MGSPADAALPRPSSSQVAKSQGAARQRARTDQTAAARSSRSPRPVFLRSSVRNVAPSP
jgi:hypothetical protein